MVRKQNDYKKKFFAKVTLEKQNEHSEVKQIVSSLVLLLFYFSLLLSGIAFSLSIMSDNVNAKLIFITTGISLVLLPTILLANFPEHW